MLLVARLLALHLRPVPHAARRPRPLVGGAGRRRAELARGGLVEREAAARRQRDDPEALVAIYAARVGRWRGIFAHHSWVVVKEEGAARYTRYDMVGWGSPVRTDGWPPDGRWFGNVPQPIVSPTARRRPRLIPQIRAAVASYPYRGFGEYRAWPGPNSNTFVAHVMRSVPELGAALPPTAIGKDWQPTSDIVGLTPSRTGIQVSLGGYAGLTVGWVEGIEVNFLGLIAGIDLRRPALKLPGWGRIGFEPVIW